MLSILPTLSHISPFKNTVDIITPILQRQETEIPNQTLRAIQLDVGELNALKARDFLDSKAFSIFFFYNHVVERDG